MQYIVEDIVILSSYDASILTNHLLLLMMLMMMTLRISFVFVFVVVGLMLLLDDYLR
jgi:hypothetical protein